MIQPTIELLVFAVLSAKAFAQSTEMIVDLDRHNVITLRNRTVWSELATSGDEPAEVDNNGTIHANDRILIAAMYTRLSLVGVPSSDGETCRGSGTRKAGGPASMALWLPKPAELAGKHAALVRVGQTD